ncbi:Fe-S protein assembly co-chaperone HscB [Cladophialophora bantiana CBS 173.52]|uniref:Fe-S protein assembly co-chaperone HscB n=1 Tax=Cladophialophora bantiana (strain ATCC 10958 / CBS 173.52 / CDC B-1940 / NIH 8579) TaxID=1442370 RepID=A0A0D2ESL5_CLAB1|nr:Fe-S protein assembly co-chaperone HscB [Cladophialophora bantiana CBS 173.52]KIW92871.1 Fe-S protein assembly co-chaperone HscB [Cladophialophora bantiana CBS 173.52]
MSRPAPTRQTLRHLRRLCFVDSPSATTATARRRQSPLQCSRPISTRHPRRTFSRTAFGHQEPRAEAPAQVQPKTANSTQEDPTTSPSPLDVTNYYTLFPSTLPSGPPPDGPFEISLPHLRREFLQLQSQYHPDKFPPGTPSHQKSRALSSLLNNAYKTLSDPLLRARYLLQHNHEIDITHEDNATHAGVTDQSTLLEVMEAQEMLEEAKSHDEIESLMRENIARIRETEKALREAFESDDVDGAKRECINLNYWRSLDSALHEWEPGKQVRLVH